MRDNEFKEFCQIKGYLEPYDIFIMKTILWTFSLGMTLFNVLMINFVEVVTLKKEILNIQNIIVLVFILILDLWAFYMLINLDKKKKMFVLFIGIYFSFFSMVYFIQSCEIMAEFLLADAVSYLVISVMVYIGVIFLSNVFIYRQLKKGSYRNGQQIKGPNYSLISAITALGFLGTRIFIRLSDEHSEIVIFIIALQLFSLVFALASHNIYKYYLIRKYSKYTDIHISEYKLSQDNTN